jgi:hypothetical protein
MEKRDIALFDMDGTLCDYDKGLFEELEKLRSPEEPEVHPPIRSDFPEHVKNRADLIRKSGKWWENLEKFKLGWDVLEIAKELGFGIMILTQGPRKNPSSWSGKKIWIDKNLGKDVDITITRDKGLVYGKVLVDDFPGYVGRWLEWRKRGLVIMPANKGNKDFKHPQVIRYDGTNLDEVREALQKAKDRPLNI